MWKLALGCLVPLHKTLKLVFVELPPFWVAYISIMNSLILQRKIHLCYEFCFRECYSSHHSSLLSPVRVYLGGERCFQGYSACWYYSGSNQDYRFIWISISTCHRVSDRWCKVVTQCLPWEHYCTCAYNASVHHQSSDIRGVNCEVCWTLWNIRL